MKMRKFSLKKKTHRWNREYLRFVVTYADDSIYRPFGKYGEIFFNKIGVYIK